MNKLVANVLERPSSRHADCYCFSSERGMWRGGWKLGGRIPFAHPMTPRRLPVWAMKNSTHFTIPVESDENAPTKILSIMFFTLWKAAYRPNVIFLFFVPLIFSENRLPVVWGVTLIFDGSNSSGDESTSGGCGWESSSDHEGGPHAFFACEKENTQNGKKSQVRRFLRYIGKNTHLTRKVTLSEFVNNIFSFNESSANIHCDKTLPNSSISNIRHFAHAKWWKMRKWK